MRHQLTQITFPDGTTTSYRYDPLGRRIESDASGTVTRDVYDGANLRLRFDGSNTLVASFVDGGLDAHLEETQTGQRLFYLQDGSNSTTALTDTSGAVVATYVYDSFGMPLASNSTSPVNPFTYTGREFDAKAGLYSYRSRYYAPDEGRFLSEDPVAHINEYAYTQNDPVDFGDPSGALAIETALVTQVHTANLHNAQCLSGLAAAVGRVAGAAVVAGLDQAGLSAAEVQSALRAGITTEVRNCAVNAALDALGAAALAGGPASAGATRASPVATGAATGPVGRLGSPIDIQPGTNVPGVINGTRYTGHAFDQMQGRGIPPSVVQNTIQQGVRSPGYDGATVIYEPTNDVTVILNPDGSVKTVYPGGG